MAYMRDSTALRIAPKNPPPIVKATVAPPRRRVATVDAPKVVAKPKTDWRSAMRASHRRAEAIAARYAAAGKGWGKSGDVNPFAEPGAREHQAQREANVPTMGSCYETIMQRADVAFAPMRAAQAERDAKAAERKSITDAKAFHLAQLARNERFAAEMKAAANEQWRHK